MQAHIEVFLDGVQVADAATQLHRYVIADFGEDVADHREVFRFAGKGAVQINQMQATRALVAPVGGNLDRVIRKHGRIVITPCFRRTHWPSFRSIAGISSMMYLGLLGLQGYRWPSQAMKFSSNFKPAAALFSG